MVCKARVQEFFDFYQKLDKNSTYRLDEFYAKEVLFTDPLHQVSGIDQLIAYFDRLYARLETIEFEFSEPDIYDHRVWCSWVMNYQHPRINGGRPVRVDGASRLDWESNQVICHRDFFDAGQMLWEQLPLIRRVLAVLKKRMAV